MRFRWWLLAAALVATAGVWLSRVLWLSLGILPGLVLVPAAVWVAVFGWDHRPRPVVRRPDYARIARLERELGIGGEVVAPLVPGDFLADLEEPAYVVPDLTARMVARARRACPHVRVVEVTQLCQATPTGLCVSCGAPMVESFGGWVRDPSVVDGSALRSPFDVRVR